jgi:hypothetical protein
MVDRKWIFSVTACLEGFLPCVYYCGYYYIYLHYPTDRIQNNNIILSFKCSSNHNKKQKEAVSIISYNNIFNLTQYIQNYSQL